MTLMMELKEQRREGYNEGKADGKDSALLASIRNLMESLHMTAQQAMDALKIPSKDQERYTAQL